MKKGFLFICLFIFYTILGQAAVNPISVDQAFPLRVSSPNNNTILIHWDIQPGYYLYQEHINITVSADGVAVLGKPVLPEGKEHVVPGLGNFIVYESPVDIS
ncbi:MAG: protein-disulfide reductase DsbD N-terminal domain-containing protein, partial [Proteobacteria bacterium]|nr:protein-disulfide reductase DsbD N-terminal domain-containing protein [Pseudomonadota bacterium]